MLTDRRSKGSEPLQEGKMLKAALLYAERGHPVFPCGPQKNPLTRGYRHRRVTDQRKGHAFDPFFMSPPSSRPTERATEF
jgi:hypothetical protein